MKSARFFLLSLALLAPGIALGGDGDLDAADARSPLDGSLQIAAGATVATPSAGVPARVGMSLDVDWDVNAIAMKNAEADRKPYLRDGVVDKGWTFLGGRAKGNIGLLPLGLGSGGKLAGVGGLYFDQTLGNSKGGFTFESSQGGETISNNARVDALGLGVGYITPNARQHFSLIADVFSFASNGSTNTMGHMAGLRARANVKPTQRLQLELQGRMAATWGQRRSATGEKTDELDDLGNPKWIPLQNGWEQEGLGLVMGGSLEAKYRVLDRFFVKLKGTFDRMTGSLRETTRTETGATVTVDGVQSLESNVARGDVFFGGSF